MVEPVTVNRALIVPNTGDLAGTWGSAAINPDMVAIDGMLGGFTTISLTNAPVTLSVPAGFTATPSAGPTQSQNAILTFTGTLTGNCTITFPMPGFYIVENLCVVGAYYVALASSSPGEIVCAPPGEATHVYCNGIDVKYVDLGRVGSYLDLAATAVPAWISNCTVPPYLNCDGSTFSAVTYPALGAYLGGTTLPDLRGRSRAALNQGTGRITTAGSGVDGDAILSAGGAEKETIANANLPASIPYTDTGHVHAAANLLFAEAGGSGSGFVIGSGVIRGQDPNTASATTGITINAGGANTPLVTLPPVAISGLTLIRAG